MANSTISESIPAIARRDQVVPGTPRAERPLVPKPRAASMGEGQNLRARLQFDRVALLLQGGGALGAYQAGVYEALAETGLHPDWVVGISIGAINAAIIAGNTPERRVDRLREFWEEITTLPWASTPKSSASLDEATLLARTSIR
jgi:NTE family protein